MINFPASDVVLMQGYGHRQEDAGKKRRTATYSAAALCLWQKCLKRARFKWPRREALKHQVFLGDEDFIEKFRDPKLHEKLSEVPKTQTRPLGKLLAEYRDDFPRDEAMACAYLSGTFTMKAIAEFIGVHYMPAIPSCCRAASNEISRANSSATSPSKVGLWCRCIDVLVYIIQK